MVVLFASAFAFDPAWIRARHTDAAPSLVLYDGQCGFCHGWIRLLLAEDAEGRRFRFAPLQGERAQQVLTDEQRRAVGDTVVVITADASVLSRSDAAIHIGDRLGGGWRVVTTVLRVVPRAVRDALYDAVARVRHHLASPPKEACPILPKPLRERFEG
jgi:predicted DCC family thiol-disulfide oxidoreductase YuxK